VRLTKWPAPAGLDAVRLASTLADAARALRRLSGTQWAATSEVVDSAPVGEMTTDASDTSTSSDDHAISALREPANLGSALEAAEATARRLRRDNAAAVIVLKASSLLISLGVLVMVVGVVLALARPIATDGANVTSTPTTTATTP
jgi:hypothetical protein